MTSPRPRLAARRGTHRSSPGSFPDVEAQIPATGCEPASTPSTAIQPVELARATPRPEAEPLTADLRRLHVTVSRRFLEKLEAAKDALSHARPGASVEGILEAGLDLLLARHAKRRGFVSKQQKVPRPTRTETVPAHVKRAVWLRAGGRCEWKLDSGAVCGSTTRLEFDHVTPRALGGPSTIENVRLTCRFHNDLAARQVFGDDWMDRFRRKPSPAPSPSP